jgi:hypothetical protein
MIATAAPASFSHATLIADDTPESPSVTSGAANLLRRPTFLSLLM